MQNKIILKYIYRKRSNKTMKKKILFLFNFCITLTTDILLLISINHSYSMKYTECLTPRSLVFIHNLLIIKILKYLQHTYFSLCEMKTTGNAQFGQRTICTVSYIPTFSWTQMVVISSTSYNIIFF